MKRRKETRKRIRYSRELLLPLVAESKTYIELLGKLGYSEKTLHCAIGNMQKRLRKYEIDTSHFPRIRAHRTDEIVLAKNTHYRTDVRDRLKNYKKYECSECKITKWNNKDLILDIDHINGNRTDNSLENLRFLCPNCHRQTPTWGYQTKNGFRKNECKGKRENRIT